MDITSLRKEKAFLIVKV